MKVKQKIILLISVVIVVISISAFVFYVYKLLGESANQMRYESAMSWLNAALRERLDDYYDTYGFYPRKLTDFEILFPGDNAKPEMLESFEYLTDETSYEISYDTRPPELYIHKEQAVKGQIISIEIYVAGELYSRTEYNNGCLHPFSGVETIYRDSKPVSRTVYKDSKVVGENR